MRMLDAEREQSVRNLQLYLSIKEATELRDYLNRLLTEPEASAHFHVFDKDMFCELSASIVTPSKLAAGHYTELERKIFAEK